MNSEEFADAILCKMVHNLKETYALGTYVVCFCIQSFWRIAYKLIKIQQIHGLFPV